MTRTQKEVLKKIKRLSYRRHNDACMIKTLMRHLRRLDKMPSDKLFYDEGKKGMKRGQHVMARDPDYLASLKGGIKGGAIVGAGLGLGHSSLKSAVNYVQNADNTLNPGGEK